MFHYNKVRPAIESLERRDLLAWWNASPIQQVSGPGDGGNVTVAVESGVLVIRGDAGPNGVLVYHLGNGRYRLDSLNGTTLNGHSTDRGPLVLWNGIEEFGAVHGVRVDLGNGDDHVGVYGRAITELVIETGADDDGVFIDGVVSPLAIGHLETDTIKPTFGPASIGKLHVETGDGDDTFGVFADVASDAIVHLGGGLNRFESEKFQEDLYFGQIYVYLRAGGRREVDLEGDGEAPAHVLRLRSRNSEPEIVGPLRLDDLLRAGPVAAPDPSESDPLVFISLLESYYGPKTEVDDLGVLNRN